MDGIKKLRQIWESFMFKFIHQGPFFADMKKWHWHLDRFDHLFAAPPVRVNDIVRVKLCMTRGHGYYSMHRFEALTVHLRSTLTATSEGFLGEVLDDTSHLPSAPKRGDVISIWPYNIERVKRN